MALLTPLSFPASVKKTGTGRTEMTIAKIKMMVLLPARTGNIPVAGIMDTEPAPSNNSRLPSSASFKLRRVFTKGIMTATGNSQPANQENSLRDKFSFPDDWGHQRRGYQIITPFRKILQVCIILRLY